MTFEKQDVTRVLVFQHLAKSVWRSRVFAYEGCRRGLSQHIKAFPRWSERPALGLLNLSPVRLETARRLHLRGCDGASEFVRNNGKARLIRDMERITVQISSHASLGGKTPTHLAAWLSKMPLTITTARLQCW